MNKETMIATLKTYQWVLVAGAAALGIAGSFFLGNQSAQTKESQATVPLVSSTEATPASSEVVEETETASEIVVDVKGAVKEPGLYSLKAGSRVHDAVQVAGGFSETADPKSVNLAQKVADESIVYVAAVGEGVSVIAPDASSVSTSPSVAESGLINLNNATESDLQTISGIGAKRAADIIAYREANGGFKSVDDLNNVSGIGDKTLESLRPYVTVD